MHPKAAQMLTGAGFLLCSSGDFMGSWLSPQFSRGNAGEGSTTEGPNSRGLNDKCEENGVESPVQWEEALNWDYC